MIGRWNWPRGAVNAQAFAEGLFNDCLGSSSLCSQKFVCCYDLHNKLPVLPAPLLQQVLTGSLGQEPGILLCVNPDVSVPCPIPNAPILHYVSGIKREGCSQQRSLLITLPRNDTPGCLEQIQLLLLALGKSCQSNLKLVLAYHVYVLGPLLSSLPLHLSCILLHLRLQMEWPKAKVSLNAIRAAALLAAEGHHTLPSAPWSSWELSICTPCTTISSIQDGSTRP